MNLCCKPIENCYWVNKNLLASEYPGHVKVAEARLRLRRFLAEGLDYFMDLTQVKELEPYNLLLEEEAGGLGLSPVYIRKPIVDYSTPTKSEMVEILDLIDSAIAGQRQVVIHCWGGVGRTGTVVGCYLVRQGLSGKDALQMLREHWKTVSREKRWHHPNTPESPAQHQMVLDWQEP